MNHRGTVTIFREHQTAYFGLVVVTNRAIFLHEGSDGFRKNISVLWSLSGSSKGRRENERDNREVEERQSVQIPVLIETFQSTADVTPPAIYDSTKMSQAPKD
jgi:hypothetical protein